eukprot:GFKZ01000204.1.p1 GENE.GFKZ01000204.1~~GFKZ01000204.1.p1  ORF type:complete len:684 (+),score=64.69 GFKZ01000204.1:44-2053(+)
MPNAQFASPRQIESEVVSDEEYNLLTAALVAAEHGPIGLSTYLTHNASCCTHSNPTLQITLQPRPRFPPPLHSSLIAYAVTSSTTPPHLPLSFPLSSLPTLSSICAVYNLPISIPQPLIPLLTNLQAQSQTLVSHAHIICTLSPHPWSHLHPFQRDAVLRGISALDGRLLLADDMGLGKTVQALCIAYFYYKQSPPPAQAIPVLVLCPPSLRDSWAQAIPRWLPVSPIAVHLISSVADFRRLVRAAHAPLRDTWDSACHVGFVVMTYEMLHIVSEGGDMNGVTFQIVIADECHVLRNISSARTKTAVEVLSNAERMVLLSGTPVLSRPMELYPILSCLLKTKTHDFLPVEQFCERYCGNGRRVTYALELNALMATVMIRRTKADVATDLPPKVRRHVSVAINPELMDPIWDMRKELEELELRRGQVSGTERAELERKHKRICQDLRIRTSTLKIPGVLARVGQLLREGTRKILVFAHFLHVLDALEGFARRKKIGFVRLDGRAGVNRRAGLVESFQGDASVRLGILSLSTGGTGLTLTAADVVLFAELTWVPSDLVQAEDRAHRLGRVGPVNIEYVVAAGTVDDLMWSVVKSKLGMVNETVDGAKVGRKAALDVSIETGKRVRISTTDGYAVLADALLNADSDEQSDVESGGSPCNARAKIRKVDSLKT